MTAGDARDDDAELQALAARVGERLLGLGWRLCTAESCTGGWLAKIATDLPGSSQWFDRGLVTYSNEAKQELLRVAPDTLLRFGAVSEETVAEMARGALLASRSNVAVAVSGIAGPSGGSKEKPVGTVCFGWAVSGRPVLTRTLLFPGDREAVRRSSVRAGLEGVLERIDGEQ